MLIVVIYDTKVVIFIAKVVIFHTHVVILDKYGATRHFYSDWR